METEEAHDLRLSPRRSKDYDRTRVTSLNLCDYSIFFANLDGIALALSQQGFRQRRDVGQCPARGIGLVRADDPKRLVAPNLMYSALRGTPQRFVR